MSMRASITADPSRGPGYGIIQIHDAGAVAGEPLFVLQRASDGKSLSSGGWQESESSLAPDAWDNDGGSLRLAVGPAVVDEVDNLDAYRISLPGSGACVLTVRDLIYSHISGGQGVGVYASPPATPENPPVTGQNPEPEPVADPDPAPEAFEQETLPEPQNVAAQAPLSMAGDMPEKDAARQRGKLWVLLLILLLLLAAGLGATWFLTRAPEQPPLPVPPATDTSGPQANETARAAAPAPLVMAREHLRGEARPDVSLALAKPMRRPDATPEQGDAAFLLLEDAAQKGNDEAMFLVGQFYDPASTLPRGSIPVDMSQARRWYEEALRKGRAEAQKALDSLREHARVEAAKGNAEARALLQNWK